MRQYRHSETFFKYRHWSFSGYVSARIDKDNEKEILKNRIRKIERSALKARIKSLKWLNGKISTVETGVEWLKHR